MHAHTTPLYVELEKLNTADCLTEQVLTRVVPGKEGGARF